MRTEVVWSWPNREKALQRRLSNNLRQRLNHALRRRQRTGSAIRDLGCTIREFMVHLEQRFLPGMSWSNYGVGTGKWSIDHMVPLLSVDLTDHQQLLQVSHYSNLQPLWFCDNVSKGAKV